MTLRCVLVAVAVTALAAGCATGVEDPFAAAEAALGTPLVPVESAARAAAGVDLRVAQAGPGGVAYEYLGPDEGGGGLLARDLEGRALGGGTVALISAPPGTRSVEVTLTDGAVRILGPALHLDGDRPVLVDVDAEEGWRCLAALGPDGEVLAAADFGVRDHGGC